MIVKLSDKIIIAQNTLVVLCGIAGCGKSTFAAKHFLPTQIVSSDECRALICDDAMNQQVTGHAFELWRLIIRKRLLIGKTTVADATNLESGDRKWLLNTARYYNFFATVMVFDLPIETCLARNARRQRVVPEDALFRQYELFQASVRTIPDEGFDAVWVLDEAQQALLTIEKTPI
ncbi:MAG: AAA family ATPase [Acidobacteria bacterium]|nr:AAA family ATPase [Acidobacteriota bacterium]